MYESLITIGTRQLFTANLLKIIKKSTEYASFEALMRLFATHDPRVAQFLFDCQVLDCPEPANAQKVSLSQIETSAFIILNAIAILKNEITFKSKQPNQVQNVFSNSFRTYVVGLKVLTMFIFGRTKFKQTILAIFALTSKFYSRTYKSPMKYSTEIISVIGEDIFAQTL